MESQLFPKLLSMNSQLFEYESCSFSEKNLKVKEKDVSSKEGAGRVAIYKLTSNINCYTLECNYNSGKIRNVLSELAEKIEENTISEEGMTILLVINSIMLYITKKNKKKRIKS